MNNSAAFGGGEGGAGGEKKDKKKFEAPKEGKAADGKDPQYAVSLMMPLQWTHTGYCNSHQTLQGMNNDEAFGGEGGGGEKKEKKKFEAPKEGKPADGKDPQYAVSVGNNRGSWTYSTPAPTVSKEGYISTVNTYRLWPE